MSAALSCRWHRSQGPRAVMSRAPNESLDTELPPPPPPPPSWDAIQARTAAVISQGNMAPRLGGHAPPVAHLTYLITEDIDAH
mmetsp:Transcript_15248/g.37205  ORF Transcript_15248/g.37205 Transcript_15248/m.37205 type:complete len:83 (+) Transcript_15248:2912-3160(+)